jgi:hypothetical protein
LTQRTGDKASRDPISAKRSSTHLKSAVPLRYSAGGADAMARALRILAVLLILPLLASAGPADDGRWYAGSYSFSDELGGFRILSVKGTGTKSDPIEISEELHSAEPVTLVIRASHRLPASQIGTLYLRVAALNGSGLAWIEFAFELQEVRGKPSDFYDGLSFAQVSPAPDLVSSDRFASFESRFESFDSLRFSNGHADPLSQTRFGFFITDVTPVDEFYLLQDPRVPFS